MMPKWMCTLLHYVISLLVHVVSELFMFLRVVFKKECIFHCYKLCGMNQAWNEHVTSSDTAQ
jgi:hypothetical protein